MVIVYVQFKDFSTESQADVVSVLAGGLTLANSRQMAMLSGKISGSALPVYTSNNNFMIVTFSTDIKISNSGFRAVYSTGKTIDCLCLCLCLTTGYLSSLTMRVDNVHPLAHVCPTSS